MTGNLFRSRVGLVVLASVLTAGAIGGVSYAVAAGTGTGVSTFYGCSTATGALRSSSIRVDTAPTCKTGETQQSWNASGPTGPQGAVGQASVVTIDSSQQCPQAPDPSVGATPGSMWLDIPTIAGEATDNAHANQIDVLTFSLGASAGSCRPGGPASTAGRPSFNDFAITKRTDIASPPLMLASMQGAVLAGITLNVRKPAASNDYLMYHFENVLISGFKFSSSGGKGDVLPTENVTFSFGKLTVTYRVTNNDGTLAPPVTSCFDTAVPPTC